MNINSTIYNTIIYLFPCYSFREGINGFIKIPFSHFLSYVFFIYKLEIKFMFSIKCFTKNYHQEINLSLSIYWLLIYFKKMIPNIIFIKRYLNLSFLFKSIFKFIIKRDILIIYIYIFKMVLSI